MVLLTPSEYPITFDFFKYLKLDLADAEGRNVLPNIQEILEKQLEHSEENHKYLVGFWFLKLHLTSVLACTSTFGARQCVFSSCFYPLLH